MYTFFGALCAVVLILSLGIYGVEKSEPIAILKPAATFAQMSQVLLQHMLTFATMLRSAEAVTDWKNFSLINKNCHSAVANIALQSVLKVNGEYELFKKVMRMRETVLDLEGVRGCKFCKIYARCYQKEEDWCRLYNISLRTGLGVSFTSRRPTSVYGPWGQILLPETCGAHDELRNFLQKLTTTFYSVPTDEYSRWCGARYYLLRFSPAGETHEPIHLDGELVKRYRGKPVIIYSTLAGGEAALAVHKVEGVDLEALSEFNPQNHKRPRKAVQKIWKTMQEMYAQEMYVAEFSKSSEK